MTRPNDKQLFIAGYLEAQPEWREASRFVRGHRRRALVNEVTPEFVESVVSVAVHSIVNESWEFHDFCDLYRRGDDKGRSDTDNFVGNLLRRWRQELLEEKGFMERAEAAWAEYQRDSAASA